MLVEFRKFPVYLVASRQHHHSTLKSVVNGVSLAVGHPAVGIGVACAPLQIVAAHGVLTRQLSVCCYSATVVVFRPNLVVRLRIHAHSVGISSVNDVVEYVFQLILVVARLRQQGNV